MHDHLKPLAELDDWQLEHESQDVRGHRVTGADGQSLGTVREMLVDRDGERVAAITLSDGRTIPVEDFEIRDGGVFMKGAGMGGAAALAGGRERQAEGGAVAEERIPIVEEHIRVGKRTVETGGVRVQSRVVEAPVHEQVRLRDEQIEVERRPVSGESVARGDAGGLFRDRTVEMTETDEQAVVAKEAIVKEELVVRKDVSERQEQIDDTVRRTEVDVDKLTGNEADRDRR